MPKTAADASQQPPQPAGKLAPPGSELRRRQVRVDDQAVQAGQVKATALIDQAAPAQPPPDPVGRAVRRRLQECDVVVVEGVAGRTSSVMTLVERWRAQVQHWKQHEPDRRPRLGQGEHRNAYPRTRSARSAACDHPTAP